MLRSLRHMLGYQIHGSNGDLGKIDDFYFDDRTWTVRYVVIQTGSWLRDRRVLLSPESAGPADPAAKKLSVGLTLEQIRSSPDVASELPVARQMEAELAAHYGWAPYWEGFAIPPVTVGPQDTQQRPKGDPHLRSVREVTGYHLDAKDGPIGKISDFMLGVNDWVVHQLQIDTGTWLHGHKAMLAPACISSVDWQSRSVKVDLPREQIQKLPATAE